MALGTFGTNGTNTLGAMIAGAAANNALVALIANGIKDDLNPAHPVWPGAFSRAGLLYIPNRGVLQVKPGDYVAISTTGWPILVSAAAVTADFTFVA